jgi:two-component system sensor histidine kinase/response regulator
MDTTSKLQKIQGDVTLILAQPLSFNETIQKLIQVICDGLEWDYAAIWYVIYPDLTLRCIGAWQRPTLTDQDFLNLSLNSEFALGRGLPGRVLDEEKPIWLFDMPKDKSLSRSSVAKKVGLHTAMCIPLFTHDRIVGVMELFTCKQLTIDEALLEWMLSVGLLIGQYIGSNSAIKHEPSKNSHF